MGDGKASVRAGVRRPARATRTATRHDILDMFGSGAPGIAELTRVHAGWDGTPQSQVMLRSLRLPAPQAALLNPTVASPLGSPENCLSIEQLRIKFADCARNAMRPLPDDAVRVAADTILHL
jgi:hypothetical protein